MSRIPEVLRIAYKPSVLSRMTPNNLTPTQKMIMARARIWSEIIGGNVRTGLRYARAPMQADSKIAYFDYSITEFYLPFKPENEEANTEIDDYRELRNSRKGKPITSFPKSPLKDVPKFEAKRYIAMESRRKARDDANNRRK